MARRRSDCSTATEERVFAADENLLNSTRSTDFITPKSRASRTFRNAVLSLAKDHAFGRGLVNSGRLSVPAFLVDSSLNTSEPGGRLSPGACCPGRRWTTRRCATTRADCWLLDNSATASVAMYFVDDAAVQAAPTSAMLSNCSLIGGIAVQPLLVSPVPGTPVGALPCVHDIRAA
jgi:3-(3-hydroxy-phenyl)propionate hydroxylase